MVGDAEAWPHLSGTYNKLKHAPGFSVEERGGLRILSDTGALFFAVELLCRVARNKRPAQVIFGDAHHTWHVRGEIRGLLQVHA